MIDGVNILIDTNVLNNNLSLFRQNINKETKIIAVIKANGYGCGLEQIGKYLERKYIDILAVVSIQEAIALRESEIKIPILILGPTFPEDFNLLYEYDLIQGTLDYDYACKLNQYGIDYNVSIKVHLKINTGLNRLGMKSEREVLNCFKMKGLSIEGMYSHLASAQRYENEEVDFTLKQVSKLKEMIQYIENEGYNPKCTHIQNSPSLIHFGDLGFDAIRCGMVLFGLFHPEQLELAFNMGYRPVYTLETRVVVKRTLEALNYVGYGRTYETKGVETMGLLSAGYCDGISRKLAHNKGCVEINGKKAPIIGEIAMSQTSVNLSNINCNVYDRAYFFKSNDDSMYKFILKTEQTINEFISGLRRDIPRIYI